MASSLTSLPPVSPTSQLLNDVPDWAAVAIAEITSLDNLLSAEANLPNQPASTLKEIVGLMSQLQQLESGVVSGSVSLSDFNTQIGNIIQQVQNLPAPP